MRADGSNIRDLTAARGRAAFSFSPDFSPDAKSIIYARRTKLGFQIWKMRSDGSRKHALTHSHYKENLFPAFSPDGRKIVFMRNVLDHASDRNGLYVMNANGSARHKVPHTSGVDLQPSW
jgi:Tol biopolymer transport system component